MTALRCFENPGRTVFFSCKKTLSFFSSLKVWGESLNHLQNSGIFAAKSCCFTYQKYGDFGARFAGLDCTKMLGIWVWVAPSKGNPLKIYYQTRIKNIWEMNFWMSYLFLYLSTKKEIPKSFGSSHCSPKTAEMKVRLHAPLHWHFLCCFQRLCSTRRC